MSLRILLVLSFLALHAEAHAILKSSVPRAQQVVSGPDVTITLTFNSRIDAKRSRVVIVSTGTPEHTLSFGEQPSPDVMTTVVKGLRSGHYVIRWQVLAADGHISRGEIPFEIQ
jgi:methionine-rich copper-binding protein CopC